MSYDSISLQVAFGAFDPQDKSQQLGGGSGITETA